MFNRRSTTRSKSPHTGVALLRKAVVAGVATVSLAGVALLGPAPEPAAALSVPELFNLTPEAPYVHRDSIGRKWIYGASSTSNTAFSTVRSRLFQYYGGRWNQVGYNAKSTSGYNRTIAIVLCTGAQTNYSFYTSAEMPYGATTYIRNSRTVTLSC